MAKEKLSKFKGFHVYQEDNWEFKVQQDMNFKIFYRMFHEFLEEEEYHSMYNDMKIEPYYDENHLPNGKREYRIRWRVYRNFKNSNFIKAKYIFNWLVLDCKDKQTVINGKKMEIQNAEVEIKCWMYLLVDEDRLRKSVFLNPFANIFFKRWFRRFYNEYKDEAKGKGRKVLDTIKKMLDMRTYGDTNPLFHRGKGFEDPNRDVKK